MDIKLYYAPITCALVPWITLTEAGAEFEAIPLNFRKGENNSPEYLAINPKHKVPLLVVDGRTLSENVAIHQWVDQTFPDAGILPRDPWDRLQAVSMLSWCSGGIHPYLRQINNPAKVAELPEAADSIVALSRSVIEENFGIGDNLLEGKDYFFGDFTAPDAHFFWCCRRATQFDIPLDPFPNVAAHFDRMLNRDIVKRLLAFEKSVQDQFAKAA